MMSNVLKLGGNGLNIENWKVLHPNGKHMFTCGEKRAYWYLNRNLANIISNNTIQLIFEPKGWGYDDGETFGLSERYIKCVVSGKTTDLQKHHIVPYCYRCHFPEEYKSRNHHDVVLINYREHARYEIIATKFKNDLAKQYNVPTIQELNRKYVRAFSKYAKNRMITMSRLVSIFNSGGNMKQESLIENLRFVSNVTGVKLELLRSFNYIQLYAFYLGIRDVYTKDIQKHKKKLSNRYDHGRILVEKLKTEDNLQDFVKLWRKHFIENAKPKYMPIGWSVNFRCKVKTF